MACVLVLCRNLWRGERELRERKKYFQLFSLFSLYANGIFLGKKQTEKKLEHYIGEGVGGATSEVPRIIIPKKKLKRNLQQLFRTHSISSFMLMVCALIHLFWIPAEWPMPTTPTTFSPGAMELQALHSECARYESRSSTSTRDRPGNSLVSSPINRCIT